ncbi:MAG TPA: phospho-N-acetylmuramoyl-pentapeptide-transferase [candidate division WOR-3 bacterium]|uniref:Phospho-N-acetylmuramoyl-pentapeptide-transferase n=1 Tax=candidate division WOR-3 bacterium TaxID=2052148 RepID=A0A7V0XEN6_UNCW3|nr:phospho-N-acetylmuramoyl-pentapeptide-transferase [candidate division WOR-3 bacterium]
MLYHLLAPLREVFSPLNLFRYITFRAAAAGAVSLVLTLLLGPVLIRLVRRLQIGQNVREEVPPTHQRKTGTPTMGGVLILAASLTGILLFADLGNRLIQLGAALLIGLGALGIWDDYVKVRKGKARGISKTAKLVVQFGLALAVGAVLYFLPPDPAIRSQTNFLLLKNLVVEFSWLYIPFVMLLVVGFSNAVNLADGLDGLAAGLLVIALASFAALCYVSGHAGLAEYLNILFVRSSGEMTVYCLALVGGALGFLWFNAHPAQVFMGDTGSLPLGGALAFVAVVSRHEFLLFVVGGVFVLEALSVMMQVAWFRSTGGRRLFRMAPLHHHFELKGWAETQVVTRFMILAVLLGLVAMASLKIR